MCTDWAHIATDETGAPERILGAKLIDLPSEDGKLRPEQINGLAHLLGVPHHAQPGVVSITQSTELGTVYTADEVGAICDAAHRLGMTVHIDGARIANAAAALGGGVAALRSFTVDAGVDVVTFGGTKNGLLGGEAVVFLRPELGRRAAVRAQAGHPAAIEDALHRRPVPGPARRGPLAPAGDALQRDGRPAVRGHRRPARRRDGRAAGQQPVPVAALRRSSNPCATGASSGTGIRSATRCAG